MEPGGEGAGQVVGGDHGVHVTGGVLAFGAVGRRVRVRRAHPGAGEPDLGPGECEDDVGPGPEGGPAAAGGRIAQDGELGEPRGPGQHALAGDALKLGQREHALLHPGAAGGDQGHEGEAVLAGVRVRGFEPVAGALAQRCLLYTLTTDSCSPVRSAARAREAS